MRSVRSCWSPISPASRAPPMRSAPPIGRQPEAEAAGGPPRQAAARAARRQAGRRWREFPAGRPRAARCARSCAGRDLGRDAPAVARRQRARRGARPAGRAHEPASAGSGVVARNASRHVDEPARAIRRTPVRCGDRAARAGRRPAARRRHAAVFRTARLARRAGLGAARGRATAARGAGRPVRRAGRRARSTMRGGRGASALRAAAWRRSRPPPPRARRRWRGGSRRARWSTSARNSGCRRCRCRRSCCIRGYATHVPAPRCAGLPTALQSRRKQRVSPPAISRRIPMTPDARKHLRANLLMLAAAAIWGSAFVAQRLSLDVIGPFLFTGPVSCSARWCWCRC